MNAENASASASSPPATAASSYNMDTDISLLEAPTFTTLDKGPSQLMLDLAWDHNVNLIGKKAQTILCTSSFQYLQCSIILLTMFQVVNPMIHCCDKCSRPILIYGRMIPCKHVFCLNCARSNSGVCSRCGDRVARVEQAGLGSIYMCSHGGSRYGNSGCRRTYLSQRDLQAHIHHRHIKQQQLQQQQQQQAAASLPSAAAINEVTAALLNARSSKQQQQQQQQQQQPDFAAPPPNMAAMEQQKQESTASHISVIGGSTVRQSNLVSVPIHAAKGASALQTSMEVDRTHGVSMYGGAGGAHAQTASSGYFGQRNPNQHQHQHQQYSHPPPNVFPGGGNNSGQHYRSGFPSQQRHFDAGSGAHGHHGRGHPGWRTSGPGSDRGSGGYYSR